VPVIPEKVKHMSPDHPAIRVSHLGKKYTIGGPQEKYLTFRDAIVNSVKAPFRRFSSHSPQPEVFWALKDVSFDVERGEVVGIIGRNGAGKSTLLKILSRITSPSEGTVDLYGRVGSLLEVGTGFHPELTGRENIFLSGSILGMKRREIDAKLDDIVKFSEIEKFLDTPVKRYSSGMYVRLAFAVAAHMDTEILLVDEVLAVGDAQFQKKCIGKMGDVAAKEGRTVLFVSHNLAAVKKLCPRSILLDKGAIVCDSNSENVIKQYLGHDIITTEKFNVMGRQVNPKKVMITNAWLEREGIPVASLIFGDEAFLIIQIDVLEETTFSVELILRQDNRLPVAFAPSGLAFDWEVHEKPGILTVRVKLPPAEYAVGKYSIDILLADPGVETFDNIESAISFNIENTAIGKRNWNFFQRRGQGYALWNVEFQIDNNQDGRITFDNLVK